MAQPTLCPECRYADKTFCKKKESAHNKSFTIIQKTLFPRARIGRADMGHHEQEKSVARGPLHNFQQGNARYPCRHTKRSPKVFTSLMSHS